METIKQKREKLLYELANTPDNIVEEALDYIKYLKHKASQLDNNLYLASESTLLKDWLKPEEDEAWKDL